MDSFSLFAIPQCFPREAGSPSKVALWLLRLDGGGCSCLKELNQKSITLYNEKLPI